MQAMISEATKKPDLLVAPAGPAPGSIFDDAYWDYNLTLAWIIYRDITLAESFSEQAPRGFENVLMAAVEGAKGAQAAAKVLLKHLRDGSQRAVSVDQVRGTTIKIKAREWLAVRVFLDGAGLAYLAAAAAITGRDNRLLRFEKSDAMNLWPPKPQLASKRGTASSHESDGPHTGQSISAPPLDLVTTRTGAPGRPSTSPAIIALGRQHMDQFQNRMTKIALATHLIGQYEATLPEAHGVLIPSAKSLMETKVFKRFRESVSATWPKTPPKMK